MKDCLCEVRYTSRYYGRASWPPVGKCEGAMDDHVRFDAKHVIFLAASNMAALASPGDKVTIYNDCRSKIMYGEE